MPFVRAWRGLRWGAPLWTALGLGACGGAPAAAPQTILVPFAPSTPGAKGSVELRQLDARPRLALVVREGDPSPALVAAVLTDAGPALSTALAAIVEARLVARGIGAESRAHRDALRIILTSNDSSPAQFFAALRDAFQTPIGVNDPALRLAVDRLEALKRHPLDAPELVPVAACTGRLGAAASELNLDPKTPAGVRSIEAARARLLHAGRTALAAVGPPAFITQTAQALEATTGFASGPPSAEAWPDADAIAAYVAPASAPLGVDVALRVPSPLAAVAAAELLGDRASLLNARLRVLPSPFRVTEVVGAARSLGGCVALHIEPEGELVDDTTAAAFAAALATREIRHATTRPVEAQKAAEQVLLAGDAGEAASRAAWWSLSADASGRPPRVAVALGVPARRDTDPSKVTRLKGDLVKAIETVERASVSDIERRIALERGQGETWVLLASPCGAADEGPLEAGATALGALAMGAAHAESEPQVEPWITTEGIGFLAHASSLGDAARAAQAAQRVADAVGRAFAGTRFLPDDLERARTSALLRIEHRGPRGVAVAALSDALFPSHPSWIEPLGPWSRVAGYDTDLVQTRWRALMAGPVRLAIIANSDGTQAAAMSAAVDRWLTPRDRSKSSCTTFEPTAPRPGRFNVVAPKSSEIAELLIGAPMPLRGSAGNAAAEVLAAALDGNGGLLDQALSAAGIAAKTSARLSRTGQDDTLLIDVRVSARGADAAFAAVEALLATLRREGLSANLIERALREKKADEARELASPRGRLIRLFSGPRPVFAAPTVDALRALVSERLDPARLAIVEARPE